MAHARTLDASMTSTSNIPDIWYMSESCDTHQNSKSEEANQISASLMKSSPTESVPASSPVTCVCKRTGHRKSTMAVVGAWRAWRTAEKTCLWSTRHTQHHASTLKWLTTPWATWSIPWIRMHTQLLLRSFKWVTKSYPCMFMVYFSKQKKKAEVNSV